MAVHSGSDLPPSATICGRTLFAQGQWLRVIRVTSEEYLEGKIFENPSLVIDGVKGSALRGDILTFAQNNIEDSNSVHYPYPFEWDNAAVLPITSHEDWLKNRVKYDVRKAIRKAKRLGVEIRTVEFNDAFVEGIHGIYNETPIRQGKPFSHYGKNFESLKREHSTFLDRSVIIGAYHEGELIGFVKMVYVDRVAKTMQVTSKVGIPLIVNTSSGIMNTDSGHREHSPERSDGLASQFIPSESRFSLF